MREKITSFETLGYLTVKNAIKRLKVRGTYKDDEYSNKNLNGTFHFENIPRQYSKLINYKDKEFVFHGKNGFYICGELTGFKDSHQLNNRKLEIYFSIKEIERWIHYNKNIIKSIKVYFNIPYVKPLERKLLIGRNKTVVKYSKNATRLNTAPYKVNILESIKLNNENRIDVLLERKIYLEIISNYENIKLKSELFRIEKFADDVLTCISLLIFMRINWISYDSYSYDINGKTTNSLFYKQHIVNSGYDCLSKDEHDFKKQLTKRNLSLIINNFAKIPLIQKIQLKRIINSFLSIKDIKIFEAKFKTVFSVVEGIGKLILQKKKIIFNKTPKTNEFFIKVMEVSKINIQFESNNQGNNLKWIITDYRNDLVHFNNTESYDFDILYEEFRKLMKLSRGLIFYYIVEKLKTIPYPENKF